MAETNNLAPRERSGGNSAESMQQRSPFLALDLMPREPHLLDYLLVLRKHQWLITFFLLTVVTIVTISTFRMSAHLRSHRSGVEVDRDSPSAFRFNESEQGGDDGDLEDYIVTQSKILQSETLAMQTVRSMGLDRLPPQFGGIPGKEDEKTRASTGQRMRSLDAAASTGRFFLAAWSVKRVPNSRLLDVTFETTDPCACGPVQ